MSQKEQDEALRSRVIDIYSICQKRNIPKYSFFLNEREVYIAGSALKSIKAISYSFFGGYDNAERVVLGVFPSYMEPCLSSFPITSISISFRKQFTLSHRDFLGSFMSLGLKRETIGDILTQEGEAVAFVYETVASTILNGINKIGSIGVELSLGIKHELPTQSDLLEISGTVASPRLDAIVRLCAGTGREEAATLIESGMVMLNYAQCTSTSKYLCVGDKFSIRGYGKFILSNFGSLTRKGRIHVSIGKYL